MMPETTVPEEVLIAAESAEAIGAGYDVGLPVETPAYEISDDRHADWVAAAVAEIEAQIAGHAQMAAEEIERLQAWLTRRTKSLDWLARALECYARAQYEGSPEAAKGKGRTISLPHGILALRKQQPEWQWEDDAVLAWLQNADLGQYVRTRHEVNKAELKRIAEVKGRLAVLPETGEVIAGVTVVDRPEPLFKLEIK
jgi:phage host-nuclease inhibitor protein Gam